MIPLSCGQTDKKLITGLLITFGASMLCPEYIAPIFLFALFIYFKNHFTKTNRKALMGTLGKVFFAYMCYMLLSCIWSNTHVFSALIALLWMGCFLGYIITANAINTKDKLKNAVTAVNISAGIIGLIAMIEVITFNLTINLDWFNFLFPNPFYYEINDIFFDAIPVEIINYRFRSRASATFDNPLILATYLVAVTPFCAFGSVYFKHSKSRKISRYCLASAIGGIVCTSSRGAYIALGLALLTMLISNKRIFKKLFPFIVVLAIAVPIGLVLRYKNTPTGDFLASTNKRFTIWQCCFEMFTKNPVLGLGAGTDNIHTQLRDTYAIENRTHAHNLFLQMLVEGGIIGAVFVIAIMFIIVKNIIKLFILKDKKYRPYAVLYTASILGFTVMSLFEFTLQSAKELMIFFIILGFIEATLRMATDKIQLAHDELITYEEINENDYEEEEEENKKVKI